MENNIPLPQRTYHDINANRRRLLHSAYAAYPEYIYCDPEIFNWHTQEGRINIFDLFYLEGCSYLAIICDSAGTHRKPNFFMLTPQGADLIEIPGKLDEKFPEEQERRHKRSHAH